MGATITTLTIEGFKSIRKLEDFELRPLNVLIGANGAGKSNFVSFFRLLREMVEERLQKAVVIEGGADALLHLGPKITSQIRARFRFGDNGYEFTLTPTMDNRFVFASEAAVYYFTTHNKRPRWFGEGHLEAKLRSQKNEPGVSGAIHGTAHYVYESVSDWIVYHFHDTSATAGLRRSGAINDNEALRPDAANLAAFLYRIRETAPESYRKIRDVVRLAAPFFDDFKLRPVPTNPDQIRLEWLQKESDYPFLASQLSDGTLRFICLATALLQPRRPATMFFDEPELGLHPYALTLLADLVRQATQPRGFRQVIVSTQSAPLLNEFEPEDVIVVERAEGQSTFRRLDSTQLSAWLEDYSLGDLWQKNILGGQPRNESAPELLHEPTEHSS